MVGAKLFQNPGSVAFPGMSIAFKGIDSKAPGAQSQFHHRLTKRAVGRASVDTEFHYGLRLMVLDQPEGKRDVFQPCTVGMKVMRLPHDK